MPCNKNVYMIQPDNDYYMIEHTYFPTCQEIKYVHENARNLQTKNEQYIPNKSRVVKAFHF